MSVEQWGFNDYIGRVNRRKGVLEMTNIRAIIIDPFKQEVREVEDDFNNFRVIQMYLRFGNGAKPITDEGYPLTLGPRIDLIHHMYLDDEGLFRANQCYFELSGYPQALAGYGVILALGIDGEEQSCTLSVDFIKSLIRWQPSEVEANPQKFPTPQAANEAAERFI
jgi:hypothetical protein